MEYVYSPHWAEDAPECERCQSQGDICRECRALHLPPPLRSNWPTRLMGFKRFTEKRVEPTVQEQKVIRKNERKKMRFYCPRKVA